MPDATQRAGFRERLQAVRRWLPRGLSLDEEVFRRRHLLLCWILALHIPSLFAFGIWRGYGVGHSAVEVIVPAACLVFARLARHRRLAAFFTTAGLVFCSYALVHLSGGTIEAHFHFFILIGLIALYQDWVPFLWNVVFTVLSHGIGNTVDADIIFNHDAAQNRPWVWAVIHGVAVLAACVGVIIFWRNTELEQERSQALAAELNATEVAAAQAEADRRQAVSELFVNLARRNQSLLDRQLGLIAELEQRERSPDALSELFKLDHLATRIRRNAESLLVLSGDEPPRRWGRPVPLGEVVRAAAAEVEDYQRVEVLVNSHLEVEGRVVADLAHLLAELIENATTFSPPNTEVRVRSHPTFERGYSFVLSVEDTGIGMPAEALATANHVLAEPPEVDVRQTTLGLQVVSRLAKRYGLRVRLGPTPGGGLTALVTLPDDLVRERRRVNTVSPSLTPTTPGPAPAPAAPEPELVGSGTSTAALGVLTSVEPTNGEPDLVPDAPGPDAPAPSVPPPPPVHAVPDGDSFVHVSALDGRHQHGDVGGGSRAGVSTGSVASVVAGAGGGDLTPPRLWADGWHLVPPGQAPRSSPSPAAPTAPGETTGEPLPPLPMREPAPVPERTADGLVRRVPGAGLAPGLRRRSGGARREPTGSTPVARVPQSRDRERMRSMLSRFQASQRAGRAAAQSPAESGTQDDQAPKGADESHEVRAAPDGGATGETEAKGHEEPDLQEDV